MKKKVLLTGLFAFCIAAGAMIFSGKVEGLVSKSALMQNIEALAGGEYHYGCDGSGTCGVKYYNSSTDETQIRCCISESMIAFWAGSKDASGVYWCCDSCSSSSYCS